MQKIIAWFWQSAPTNINHLQYIYYYTSVQWIPHRYHQGSLKKRTLTFYKRIVWSSAELSLPPFLVLLSTLLHLPPTDPLCRTMLGPNSVQLLLLRCIVCLNSRYSARSHPQARSHPSARSRPSARSYPLARSHPVAILYLIYRLDLILRLHLIPKIMSITLLCWEVW